MELIESTEDSEPVNEDAGSDVQVVPMDGEVVVDGADEADVVLETPESPLTTPPAEEADDTSDLAVAAELPAGDETTPVVEIIDVVEIEMGPVEESGTPMGRDSQQ